jgi:tetratricopeptide (TPR) repeat protein
MSVVSRRKTFQDEMSCTTSRLSPFVPEAFSHDLFSSADPNLMRRGILLGVLVILAAWGGWTLFHQYKERAANAVELERDSFWNPTFQQAQAAMYANRCDEAEPILQSMLPKAEEWWPNGSRLEAVLIMLGRCYRADHRYELAEPLLMRALNFNDTSDPIRVARIKINLGIIYRDQGRYDQAEKYFTEALAVDEKNTKAAQADDALAMLNLGFLREMHGSYEEAQSFYTRAVAIYEADLGSKPFSDLANAYYNLAQSYERQNRYADAATQYQNSAVMYEQLGEQNRLDTVHALDGLASMEYSLGQTALSRETSQRSQDILKELASGNSPADCRTLYTLGSDAHSHGKLKEAESFYKRSIEVCEHFLGPNSPDLARPLGALGVLYRDNDIFDMKLAGPLFQRALNISEKALGPDSPFTAEALSDLALLYFFEKDPVAGERSALRALAIQEKQQGPDTLTVSTTLNRLGLCQRDLRKFPQSERNLKRALAIREQLLPPNSPGIVISLENLASVYEVQEQPEKANLLIARARAIQSQSGRPQP